MINQLILNQLCTNEEYVRRALPFLKDEYFERGERLLFAVLSRFITKYNTVPTEAALKLELQKIPNISNEIMENVARAYKAEPVDIEWVLDETEKFCQDRAIYLAIMESIQIIDGKHKELSNNAIPDILSKALSVSFDTNVGHDYIDASDTRYDFYHKTETRIPFDLDFFNKITKNGVPKKTLNVVMGGVGGGKSLSLCHFTAGYLNLGKNVLYITLELSEERVAERIDANLLNITLDDLMLLPKDVYKSKIEKLKEKTHGKLIVKEYATSTASTNHFRSLLNELNLKKNFVPDAIMIDYLNICSSSRVKAGVANSYTYIKAIAEELRGLAVEFNVPVWSATQLTRGGYGSSDPDMTDTSESFGLPATADFFVALITNETMEQLKQIQVKQLKNRYGDPGLYKRFVIGVDRSKLTLSAVEQSAQDIVDSGQDETPKPVFDRSKANKFKGLKV